MIQNEVLDMSFDEFSQVNLIASATVMSARLGVRRGVFSGDPAERDAIRAELFKAWKISSTVHDKYETPQLFVAAVESEMLRVLGQSRSDFFSIPCNFGNVHMGVVFNLNGAFSNERAMQNLYATYCERSAAQKNSLSADKGDDQAQVPRERA